MDGNKTSDPHGGLRTPNIDGTGPEVQYGSATTATSKALNTPELLEMILLALPCKDVLYAQRVSKAWRNSISSSPILQQALCLRTVHQAATPGDHESADNRRRNMCQKASLSTLNAGVPAVDFYQLSKDPISHLVNAIVNAFFKKHARFPPFKYVSSELAATYIPSSLDRIYVCQPPAHQIWVFVSIDLVEGGSLGCDLGRMSNGAGVKVGDLARLHNGGGGTIR